MLALAGSAAAQGAGSVDVRPGMNVVDAKGRAIGTVRALKSEADGRANAHKDDDGQVIFQQFRHF